MRLGLKLGFMISFKVWYIVNIFVMVVIRGRVRLYAKSGVWEGSYYWR